ncbi:MAG: TonB-dependent receptor [Acidobacteria bacterium]|nr:TonB-dependent receptor [Acidobacteriota bacterium]MBI3280545.1 TonB-dependent receptor [Acidobacteriota bacterium]
MSNGLFRILLIAGCLPAACVPLAAQIGGGSIIGYITDPSGAAVAAVTIRAANVDRNVVQETVSNERGYYEFPLLPAGRYRLEAEAQGFQKATSADFTLNAGTRPRIDLKLAIGQITESVEVVAAAPLVNASTTDLGVVMEQSKVESLPLNGRNFEQLVGLQAGVLVAPPGAAGGRGGIEFHGSSALSNNLLLDGNDMTFGEVNGSASDRSAGAGGTGSLIHTVSVEAIAEFKATGSAFSAEYGRASGGVLNITTKSGTNRFHGALFEFFRNDKLDANSFFSNRSNLPKPPLRWNQYGGNLGGPIRKDRVFFFFNYEGATVRRNQQISGNVATPLLLNQLKPEIRRVMELAPVGDYTPTSNPLVGFHRRNDRRKNDENTYLGRVDAHFSKHRLATRYSYNHQDVTIPQFIPTLPRLFPTRFHNAVVQDSFTVSPSAFNELRLGMNRNDLFRNEPGRERVPAWITVAGISTNVSLISFIHFITTTYTLADNFSLVRGRHTMKAGFEIREVRSARDQGGQPSHSYNSAQDLIADRPNRVGLLFGGGKGLRTRNYGFYIQDDWRVSARMQLNAGLRYEYSPPLKGGFNVTGSDPYAPFNRPGEPMFAPDRNNFAPRVGLVFDPTGNQKLVVRAGGGIAYGPPQPFYYYDMAFIDPRLPFVANVAPADLPFPVSYPFSNEFVQQIAANPGLLPASLVIARRGADYNRRDEYSGQWNLSVQYEATPALALQASYVGSRSLKLYNARVLNLVDPSLGRRPHPEFGDVIFAENAANASYHALQLSANQRLWRGLTFDTYYTYGKNLGYYHPDGTLTIDGAIQNPENLRDTYGPRDSDIRHRFVSLHSYALPDAPFARSGFGKAVLGGWTVQGIITLRSGLPFNVTAGRDLAGNGRSSGQRPDLVGGVEPYVRDTDALRWLNPAAFDVTTPQRERRFGNLGFNALRGPSGFTYDFALHKQFAIRESHRVTFRFEAFNVLNHKVLSSPNATVTNPNFGQILGASGGRNIQFALKYMF